MTEHEHVWWSPTNWVFWERCACGAERIKRLRRWYRPYFNNQPENMLEPVRIRDDVRLRCACEATFATIDALIQHRRDFHAPGLCTRAMLLRVTEEWRAEWLADQETKAAFKTYADVFRNSFPITYHDAMRARHGDPS